MRMLRFGTTGILVGLAFLGSVQIAAGQQDALLEDERNTIRVFQQTAPSVVFIINKVLRQDIFTRDVSEIPRGSGSGFVWDQDGHIVTNYHVVQEANTLTVTFADQSTFDAEIVGVDPSKDLAVIKVEAPQEKLHPIPVGALSGLLVGQKVLAIGNPFGLDHSLTTGVVSALGREITSMTNRKIRDVIQTDAAINPGNSGGPLLDSQGRLIGVNTSIIGPSGANAGIGFAVPVNIVKQIVPQLIEHGEVIQPGLGVILVEDSIARRLGIKGVIIRSVNPGSAAEKADLRGLLRGRNGEYVLGDVIVAIKGIEVENYDGLAYVLEQCRIGETVTVEYLRDGKQHSTRVTLQRID
ncbi:MAG: trypsin-like peptidase domain-containing protein [Candidatus Aminicenantaceae bacterium]